ncbi:MAG TPA: nucleotidyl transferase AbiEii/AbiGii toxin family protein [Kofleriaceae bacterium]
MALGKLSALQQQILIALANLRPTWTLTGGAALAGFHTQHRETRDLDLFFHHQRELGSIVADATEALRYVGLAVIPVRSSTTFAQLDVRLENESTIVDLVADPTPVAEVAQAMTVDDATIMVERFRQDLVERVMAEARPGDSK